MSASIYGRGLKGKATKLHAEVVRSRGRCQRCGSTSNLQCAHIIPRRYNAVRTDEQNAWALCAGCHLRTTEWASEHMALVESTIGLDTYEQLRQRAEAGVKANDAFWSAEIERLSHLLGEAA